MVHFTKIFRQEAFLGLLRHSHGYHQFVQVSARLVRGFRRADGARITGKPEVNCCYQAEMAIFQELSTQTHRKRTTSQPKRRTSVRHPRSVPKSPSIRASESQCPPPKMTSNPLCSRRSPSKPSQAPLECQDVERSLSTSKLRFAVCPSCSPASLAATRRFFLREAMLRQFEVWSIAGQCLTKNCQEVLWRERATGEQKRGLVPWSPGTFLERVTLLFLIAGSEITGIRKLDRLAREGVAT